MTLVVLIIFLTNGGGIQKSRFLRDVIYERLLILKIKLERAAQVPGAPQDHRNTGNTYLNQTSNVGEGRSDGLLPRGMPGRN